MNNLVNGHNVWIIVAITFLVSLLLVPIVKKIAIHLNAIDYPDERRIHTKPTPRIGGLAIFLSFLVGYMLFAGRSTEMLSVLIGGFTIFLVGFIDDIKPIRSRYKFIGQIVAASIIPLYGGIVLNNIDAFGINLEFGMFSYPITILFIVTIMNAINFIDGMDGLSSGISSIYFLTIAIIASILNSLAGLDIILCLIMLGSTLGFLFYNFPPASIFVGDCGAMFLGFIISVIALLGFKNVTLTSLIIPIVILAIPIFDVISSVIRRVIKKQRLDNAEKEHIHHQLLKMNWGSRRTVILIYLINIAFASVSILYVLGDRDIAMMIYLILMILTLIFVFKTNILFEHKRKTNPKILFIASTGGHLSELMQLKPLFKKYNYHIVTEKTKSNLKLKKEHPNKVNYLVYGTKDHLFSYVFKLTYNSFKSLFLYFKIRPHFIITTGTHTAGPMCCIGKIFGTKIIYVETFANVKTKTATGKIIYHFADLLVVQWESMLKVYPKAKYGGWIY